jgi:uncharacterized SAM-binding protein YcdF (DUF218 family)
MGRVIGLFLKRVLPIALLAWVIAVAAIFALNRGEKPVHADAVVVLEGSKTRLPVGLKLVQEGYAPLLVVSRGDRKTLETRLCGAGGAPVHVQVICFTASPASTRGEAEFIGRLARERGLTRIDVVTSKFHVFRARLVIGRCYHRTLRMVGAPEQEWKLPWYAATETAKLAYQLVIARGC